MPTVLVGDAIREGLITSRQLNRVVGCIKNFQVDYIRFPDWRDTGVLHREILQGNLPLRQTEEDGVTQETAFSGIFRFTGDWRPIDVSVLVTDCVAGQAVIYFSCSAPVTIHFNAHPWSGIVEIWLNNLLFKAVDLYAPHTSIPQDITIPLNPVDGSAAIEIRATGRRNPMSMGRQCLFRGCSIFNGTKVPIAYQKPNGNSGADFTKRFWDMLSAIPSSGLVLDVGGGNRQINDPRYVNLDYAQYPEPDVIGDALSLPFKDNSFDFVYSSGVFEHLRDPFIASEEIYRITKPGGRILIGIAFMQPIHSEGQHFFNCTVWGIQELFKKFRVDDVLWEGSMSFLVEWMISCTQLDSLVGSDEIAKVIDPIKRWDSLIEHDRLKYIANGVYCVGTKIT